MECGAISYAWNTFLCKIVVFTRAREWWWNFAGLDVDKMDYLLRDAAALRINLKWEVGSFLASQDALEVMRVTHSLSNWVSVSIDFIDVTLVSDDTYKRLYWCDPDLSDDPDESYLVMKVILWWKLSSDGRYLVMKVI